MYYDTFDSGFGVMPNFNSGFGQPMFNGTGCFPAMSFDMGINNGFAPSFTPEFGVDIPMTCGYSPTPFGCNPVSMDFNGNVCIDGIPLTPSTPPAWMTARAAQAEMHLNQLEMQLNDPNFWMNFMPPMSQPAFPNFVIDWNNLTSLDPVAPVCDDLSAGMAPSAEFDCGIDNSIGTDIGFGMTNPMTNDIPLTIHKEEIIPCGLTKSAFDSILSSYQKNLADCERQLENCDPYHSAQRAMIQNNIDRINRNIRDLDKPLGKI